MHGWGHPDTTDPGAELLESAALLLDGIVEAEDGSGTKIGLPLTDQHQ